MYLKIAGCLLVILAGAGYGYSRGLEYRRRVEETEYLGRLLRRMQGETAYTKAALPEVCRRCGRGTREPYRSWLLELARGMEERDGQNLAQLWERRTGRCLEDTCLTKEQKKELGELGAQMGYLDARMQEETLGWYAGRVEEERKKLAAEAAEKRRLCGCMGVMAGMFLAILLM